MKYENAETDRELPQVLNVEQVARTLDISPAAVRRLLILGQIPGKKLGKRWRILRSAFETHLAGGA